jgi:hypothetical protein
MRIVRAGLVAELPRRLLLQARRDERRRRVAAPLLLLDLRDRPVDAGRGTERRQHLVDPRLVLEPPALLSTFCPSTSTSRAVNGGGASPSRRASTVQYSSGVKARISRSRSQMMRTATGLHAPGREAAAHLLPQERRELVADEAVEHAARLLRLEAVLVELPRGSRAPRAPPSS